MKNNHNFKKLFNAYAMRLLVWGLAAIGLLAVLYYAGYFLVSRDFIPDIAKSAGSLLTFNNNVKITGDLNLDKSIVFSKLSSEPPTPAADTFSLYFKDGALKAKNENGNIYFLGWVGQMLDEILLGSVGSWSTTRSYKYTPSPSSLLEGPVITASEIISPLDNSTSLKAHGEGGSGCGCSAVYKRYTLPLTSPGGKRITFYYRSDRSGHIYTNPGIDISLYRSGSQIGRKGYSVEPGRPSNCPHSNQITNNAVNKISLDSIAVSDFDAIEIALTSYLCAGWNESTIDNILLE